MVPPMRGCEVEFRNACLEVPDLSFPRSVVSVGNRRPAGEKDQFPRYLGSLTLRHYADSSAIEPGAADQA